jgi:hypothetical protein
MACRKRLNRIYSRVLLFFLWTAPGISAYAQLLDTRVSIDLGNGSLDKCVLQLQQATGISFAYETSGLESFSAKSRSFKEEKLRNILNYLLEGSGYIFEEKHSVIVIGPRSGKNAYQFNGVIEDKETGIKLEGVAVYDPVTKSRGTFTDRNGYFSLSAPSDTLKLRLSYLSYKPVEIVLRATDAPLVRIRMHVASAGLDSVFIGDPGDITTYSLDNFSALPQKMAFLPKFSGDVDLITILKLSPGIQETRDGSGSLIVRGGSPDQNLLLMDDASIYGSTHLFGLISSVNTYAVKDIDIYKGAFPARYGGRISSVWDITLKEGNPDRVHGIFSIGTMASDFMLEGPLGNRSTTFLISGRRSYHDVYTRLFTPNLTFYFQDVNFKLRQQITPKDHLFLSGYASQDKFQLGLDNPDDDELLSTRQSISRNNENYAGVMRWRHNFSAHLLTNFSLIYSQYKLVSGNKYTSTFFFPGDVGVVVEQDEKTKSDMYDLTGKFQLKYAPNTKHEIEAGAYYTKHTFRPHVFSLQFTSTDPSFFPPAYAEDVIRDTASTEIGGYIEDRLRITDNLKANVGFHVNQYIYEQKSYFSFQPRISASYQVGGAWAINAAYVKMQQNLHRLTISQTDLPLDFWIPSTVAIRPQTSNQVSLGVSGKLLDGLLDVNVESYYKDMNNVAEYLVLRAIDTTQTKQESSWSNEVTVGKGTAYGVEFSVRKSKGKLNGWLSYALAWSNRTLPEVNNGATFPYKYDRRHSLNLVALYKLSKSLELSAVFSFQSKPQPPVPIIKTTDVSNYAVNIKNYAAAADLRAYHRLDLGINWTRTYKKDVSGVWNLSVFNVYNRTNTFYYFSTTNLISGSSLLPISASLSYTLKF